MRPLVLALALAAAVPSAAADDTPVTVAGWAEYAWLHLPQGDIRLPAKLDTGASTSSIGAAGIETFDRDDVPWVRFSLEHDGVASPPIEAQVIRTALIRRAGAAVSKRPVVRLRVCVAGRTADTEFTVTGRTGMNFPVLIGRSFLAGAILVDSTARYKASGKCRKN